MLTCGFFQECADGLRSSVSDEKRNATALMEQAQTLQSELSQSQLRRSELETELQNTQEVRLSPRASWEVHVEGLKMFSGLAQALRQRSDGLAEAQRGLQAAHADKVSLEERLRSLQRAVALLETEKRDVERQAVRLEKDKSALRNTLDKVTPVCLSRRPEGFGFSLNSDDVIFWDLFIRWSDRSCRRRRAACVCLQRKDDWIARSMALNKSCRTHRDRSHCCRYSHSHLTLLINQSVE